MFGLQDRALAMIGGGASLVFGLALAYVWISSTGTIKALEDQLTTARTEISLLTTDLTQCRANRITLEEATRRQNAAVDQARAQGEARAAELARVAERARAGEQSARRRADRLLAAQGTGNHCADADALILGVVQ